MLMRSNQVNTSLSMGEKKKTMVGTSIHSGYTRPISTPMTGSSTIFRRIYKAKIAVNGRL